MHVFACLCVAMCEYMCLCVCLCVHVFVCVWVHVCLCMYAFVCVCACMCEYMLARVRVRLCAREALGENILNSTAVRKRERAKGRATPRDTREREREERKGSVVTFGREKLFESCSSHCGIGGFRKKKKAKRRLKRGERTGLTTAHNVTVTNLPTSSH